MELSRHFLYFSIKENQLNELIYLVKQKQYFYHIKHLDTFVLVDINKFDNNTNEELIGFIGSNLKTNIRG